MLPGAYIFLDLDDTVFQTKSGLPNTDGLSVAAVDEDGDPLSFTTSRQDAFLELLSASATLVPVTGRSVTAFRRVVLEFDFGAVLNYGGLVLNPGGQADPDWLSYARVKALEAKPLLDAAGAFLQRKRASGLSGIEFKIVGDLGLDFYLLARGKGGDSKNLPETAAILQSEFGSDARVYLYDGNVSLLPKYLDKRAAVEYFINAFILTPDISRSDLLLLGAGDSEADRGFMSLCDYQIIPSGCRLSKIL
ncbi:MAG: hypothetical protein LBR53_06085 [Deltaproteobacteria bacterium]|jgi:hydroxymethylpyrimidine pyrophosphatase-like HAD family hydrolase|nr:hypothetical protein [Deltaproteobacteria bacterium]